MECSVCYEELSQRSRCTLVCRHAFCHGCIKEWCQKGSGTGCPMCRRAVYFKGFHKKQEEWEEEAWHVKTSEIMGEAIDALVEEAQIDKKEFPNFSRYFDAQLKQDLKKVDRTVRFLKSEYVHEDYIESCLAYEDHYSDRKIGAKNEYREIPRQKQFFREQKKQRPMRR